MLQAYPSKHFGAPAAEGAQSAAEIRHLQICRPVEVIWGYLEAGEVCFVVQRDAGNRGITLQLMYGMQVDFSDAEGSSDAIRYQPFIKVQIRCPFFPCTVLTMQAARMAEFPQLLSAPKTCLPTTIESVDHRVHWE